MSETQKVMAAAAATEIVTDARGRQIEVRKLTRRETMRFMRQWGTASDVQMWMGNALIAAHAKSIDGVPLPAPISADMVEAVVDRLDDDGIQAVADWVVAARADANPDTIKN